MAKKLYPVHRLDIAHMEHWLSDLADEGFFPTHFGTFFVTGNKDMPQKVTYRFIPLDASDKRVEPTPEETELFFAAGWEFVNHLDERFLVFQNKEDYPKEIPLEDEVQQERFHSLSKRFQKEYILCVTLIIIALGVFAFLFLHNFHEFILFQEAILDHFSILLFLLTLPFGRGITRKSLHNIKSYATDIKNLTFDREEDMVTTAPHLLVSAMHAFAGFLIPIIGVLFLWLWGCTAFSDDWITIEMTDDSGTHTILGEQSDDTVVDEDWISTEEALASVPQISLEKLTGGTVKYQESSYKEEYTIFAPTQYAMKQTGNQNVITTLDHGQMTSTNQITLYWNYYEVTSSQLAEITFDAWINSNDGVPVGFGMDAEDKHPIDTDLMDKAYMASVNEGWTAFWFLEDNVIVSGAYVGGKKEVITENLDLFAEVMK
ncbi:DUF2812 domain-containing protein [Chakrabartyella piscis]|uniref:DUF2812 domain-containing protein n=1 Tax=Chakrabartyella piscis TaxID=2918914 RepID=UPI002958C26F|nr:DUF2812 domain-containing protein [Chakrabartyella piscis]